MGEQTGKILVVEPDESLRSTLLAALSEGGYEVSTDYRDGMKAILAFEPDLVILGADRLNSIVATFSRKSRARSRPEKSGS